MVLENITFVIVKDILMSGHKRRGKRFMFVKIIARKSSLFSNRWKNKHWISITGLGSCQTKSADSHEE